MIHMDQLERMDKSNGWWRARGESPLFTADWRQAVFIHFAIDPAILQPHIPFPLDTRDGQAYVSLVAFTQANLRPTVGGRLGALLISPLAQHEFLNLRTYVRVSGERGIYFIAEWIPNRLAVLVGPRTYGLPYRLGRLRYEWNLRQRRVQGKVSANGGWLSFSGGYQEPFAPAAGGTFDEFLLERYVAFTHRHGIRRRFRVHHAPWPQQRIDLKLQDCSLIQLAGEWHQKARFTSANCSPGVKQVTISAPMPFTEWW